ncbi:protein FAM151A isoform X2 [Takifugu rubripes]|nr:protein FAM151A isoform X2 [Takifugu rubripes]
MCVCVGLFILILVSAVTAVVITKKSASTATPLCFPTNGDMLDFLILSGQINNRDGLLATWFHRANSKDKMNEALSSNAMILESDVTLEGYGTPNVKPIPIMAHPPNIYSDNTLDQWLDAVLASPKAMKLDFKSLDSVGLSLDVLNQKNKSRNINRPVWINADVLLGPNTPGFVPPLNGTRFLQFIQEKFPDVTVSPGWMVLYLPPLLTKTYTRQMMEDMYDLIRDVPQKVTFPIYTVLARSGWQHISWLLSLSSRFSLTLWQDSFHPNVSDLLFIRDNSHPTRVYYDIYEPTLSEFKEAAKEQGRVIRFYPGGDLMDFLHLVHNADSNSHPTNTHHSSLAVQWLTVTNKTSLFNFLSDATVGMLLIQVTSDRIQPRIPLVKASGVDSEVFTLQYFLQLLGQRPNVPLGVHLQIPTLQLLEATLKILQSIYEQEQLYRPVWISMASLTTPADTQHFMSAVETLFPYVTLVLKQHMWPPAIPTSIKHLSQRVALHIKTTSLQKATRAEMLRSLIGLLDRYDVLVEEDTINCKMDSSVYKDTEVQFVGSTNLYVMSKC